MSYLSGCRSAAAVVFAAFCLQCWLIAGCERGHAPRTDRVRQCRFQQLKSPATIMSAPTRSARISATAPRTGVDAEALDAALKSLYATGLFQDVKIAHDGGHVVVTVVENPTIGRIAFEGNKKLKDDDLRRTCNRKRAARCGAPFVQGDVEHIVELYRQSGYFDAHVTPQTIESGKGDAGRVNLVFTIKEGDKLAVRDIAFAGNSAFPANKLKGVIKSGQTNFLSFLLDNDIYDADRIENDRDLLRSFYLAHGYADVRVRRVGEL